MDDSIETPDEVSEPLELPATWIALHAILERAEQKRLARVREQAQDEGKESHDGD
jgi:hypothetical protein